MGQQNAGASDGTYVAMWQAWIRHLLRVHATIFRNSAKAMFLENWREQDFYLMLCSIPRDTSLKNDPFNTKQYIADISIYFS